MPRSIQLHPLSLLVGLAYAAVVLLSMSQAGTPKDCFGPPKKNIVNVFQVGTGVQVQPGGTHQVYTVPTDRWLTVTGAYASMGNPSAWSWVEDDGGVHTTKGLAMYSYQGFSESTLLYTPSGNSGPVGWTFRPGTSVALKYQGGSPATVGTYALIGFLSRD